MNRLRCLSALLLLLSFLIPGLVTAAEDRPLVYVSAPFLADMTAQLAGPGVEVRTLYPPDADLHSYTPNPGDVAPVAEADLVVINGLGLEAALPRLLRATAPEVPVVEAAAGLAAEAPHSTCTAHGHAHDHNHDHGSADPHAWLSAAAASEYVTAIAQGLRDALPQNAGEIDSREVLYRAQLRALDQWLKREAAAIPAERRLIVTDHDAFSWFAREYGFEVMALTSATRGSEPSGQALVEAAGRLRESGAAALFVESGGNQRLLQRLADEAGIATVAELHTSGLPEAPDHSYIGLMRRNMITLRAALAEAP